MSEEEIIKCAEYLGNREDETVIKINNEFYDERDIWKGLLDLYNKEKAIVDLMAEQLTTPVHNKEWVINYFEEKVK